MSSIGNDKDRLWLAFYVASDSIYRLLSTCMVIIVLLSAAESLDDVLGLMSSMDLFE